MVGIDRIRLLVIVKCFSWFSDSVGREIRNIVGLLFR